MNNFSSLVSDSLLLCDTWPELIPDVKSLDFLTIPTSALDEVDSLSLARTSKLASNLSSVRSWVSF